MRNVGAAWNATLIVRILPSPCAPGRIGIFHDGMRRSTSQTQRVPPLGSMPSGNAVVGAHPTRMSSPNGITKPVMTLSPPKTIRLPRVSCRDIGEYSARNSSKGALLDEAARVFQSISKGATLDTVREDVFRGTLLTQRSFHNRKRIWTSISHRYLLKDEPWLESLLSQESHLGPQSSEFKSLLYLLYALRDRLTFDFVTKVLWAKGQQTRAAISRNDVLDLLGAAVPDRPQIDRWSEATRKKLAGSILTALRDFGVLEGKQKKILVQPPLPLSTAEIIVRILVREGCRGRQILESHIWRLFFLKESDVAQVLSRLAIEGTLRFEKAGTTVVLETPASWESET